MKKRKFFRRLKVVLGYAVVVGVILALTQCEPSAKITNPYKDAQRIQEMAAGVYNEASMRQLDAMFNEMYIAYQKHIDGATAIQFYKLAEPIMEQAGARIDAIQRQEEEIAVMEQQLAIMLKNLEEIFNVSTDSVEQDRAKIEQNRAKIEALNEEKAHQKALIQEAGANIWAYWEDQEGEEFKFYTQQQQNAESRMAEIDIEIEAITLENTILELAYQNNGIQLFPIEVEQPTELPDLEW